MTLTKKESFEELNAIALGWKLSKKGYCSIDTRQDSSYFCNWVNVETLLPIVKETTKRLRETIKKNLKIIC